MSIGEFCSREVVVERQATIAEAAELMRRCHVGDVVLVDEVDGIRRPVGIVTDRDLVLAILAPRVEPALLTVGDMVTARLATVRESEGVFETMRYMRDQGVRRMPVVDACGGLVGIVSVDNFIELLAEEMKQLAALITRGLEHEATVRT